MICQDKPALPQEQFNETDGNGLDHRCIMPGCRS